MRWPPGTSTPSAPASTASSTSRCARASTCSRCRRSSARPSSSPTSSSKTPATTSRRTASRSGTASRSRAASRSTDVQHRLPRHARLREGATGRRCPAGGPRDRRDGRRGPGVEPLRAQRPRARRPALRLQARVARGAAAVHARRAGAATPTSPLALVGDFNIAPTDADNGDPAVVAGLLDPRVPARARGVRRARGGGTGRCRAPPRADRLHLLGLQAAALPDATRACASTSSSARTRSRTRSPAPRSTATSARAKLPSDHVPVVVDLDLDAPEDDDDRPMIFG